MAETRPVYESSGLDSAIRRALFSWPAVNLQGVIVPSDWKSFRTSV